MDISASSPISTHATLAAQAPAHAPPSVSTIDPSPPAGEARTDTHTANGEGQTDTAAQARQQRAHRERLENPETNTGPPPTFQVTLLEVEQDLQNILARLEIARTQERDAEALRPDAEAAVPAPDALPQTQASANASIVTPPPASNAASAATQTKSQVEQMPSQTPQQAATLTAAAPTNDGMPV